MALPGKSVTIRFGAFELDSVNRELRKRGKPVKLQPQQFAVLQLLVACRKENVSRSERSFLGDMNQSPSHEFDWAAREW